MQQLLGWNPAPKEDREEIEKLFKKALLAYGDTVRGEVITENTSDGHHTFKELYEFRLLYNAAFFNQITNSLWANVHKSKRHSDGKECFGGGWFIVMATLPTGQISNHCELKDWDLFTCEERERGDVWDGHTPQDVAERLRQFLAPSFQ